ncbi:MAG TPA: dephospho-CoA kinase [Candidatus Monoglobus merdigallinarum]|uniref:Dephospho-CoA kinase n=1 Tax=Candidatus Monoglobus merdigallinarum TaxID=2838698 RepID=A0A9D1PRZ1_9FIRM|nr:dephospho-CoA kinase [Candidatus Monoglobus merdigallinarum]
MIIIGLTGSIGAGKSAVSGIFKSLGAYIIDADKIAHEVTEKGEKAYSEIVEYFGTGILSSDGSIDRKRLGSVVFGDKAKLKMLNSITHKYIFEEIEKRIGEYTGDVAVLDVPLLFNDDFSIGYDVSVAVLADDDVRIKRVEARDGLSREQVIARMNSQKSQAELAERADYVIENSLDGLGSLREKVKKLYKRIIEQA